MITPKEAAEKLKISPKTVIKYLNKGVIKGEKFARTTYTYKVDELSLDAFVTYMQVRPGRGKRPDSLLKIA
jgi:hypothetical protein